MTTKQELTRVCPFCGKVIRYTVLQDDGYDWEGHRRGGSGKPPVTTGYDCECQTKSCKRMCLNCEYYTEQKHCSSQEHIAELNKHFAVPDWLGLPEIKEIVVKDPIQSCYYWKLNASLVGKMFR